MSEIQEVYVVERTSREVLAEGVLKNPMPHYSAQKRRLIALIEEAMGRGVEAFVLRTGAGDWTIEALGPARRVRR